MASDFNSYGFIYQFPMFCAGLIAFAQLAKSPIKEKHLTYVIVSLGLYSSIWGILNYFKIEPYHWISLKYLINPKVIPSGPLLNHTLSSVYPALALCFAPWYLSIILIAGLISYGSTMSILAGAIALIHYNLDKRFWFKNWFYLAGFAGLYALLDSSEFFSGQERINVWKSIIEKFPLSGLGLGYFYDHYRNMANHTQIFLQEHNEYLAAYTSFGLFGAIASIYAVFLVLKSRPSKAKSSTIAFLFICAGSFPLHISSLAIIGILLYTLTIQGENYGFFKHKIT